MSRDYSHLDKYLDELEKDIYPQPADPGHTAWAEDAIKELCSGIKFKSVLDVGCGEGFCSPIFTSKFNAFYTGVTLGEEDYKVAKSYGRNVHKDDISFLSYEDERFDLVFARHILEHSPMPLITLMEWYRVSKKYLALVMPAWEYWGKAGRNHYSVLDKERLAFLIDRAGWNIIFEIDFTTSDKLFLDFWLPDAPPEERVWHEEEKPVEYRYLLQKRK